MELVVLGNQSPYPGPGGACSGYLVRGEGSVLLDCGSGSLANLARHLPLWQLDAVVLSHLHGDHYADLLVLRYAIQTARAKGWRPGPLPVYGPPEPFSVWDTLPYKDNLVLHPWQPGQTLDLIGLHWQCQEARHSILALSVAVTDGRKRLVYSGDTAYHPGLVELAGGADLLLTEATLQEEDAAAALAQGHLTARQVGRLAKESGAKRVLLTHLWAGYDPARTLAEAESEVAELAVLNGRYVL